MNRQTCGAFIVEFICAASFASGNRHPCYSLCSKCDHIGARLQIIKISIVHGMIVFNCYCREVLPETVQKMRWFTDELAPVYAV